MKQISKFRDLPDWQGVRKQLKDEFGLDPNLIAELEETEGDSPDLIETMMALEEAFGAKQK